MNQEPERPIRRLLSDEPIPYDLLLLADETVEGIDRYIHQSDIYVVENEERFIAVCVLQPVDASTIEIKKTSRLTENIRAGESGTLFCHVHNERHERWAILK